MSSSSFVYQVCVVVLVSCVVCLSTRDRRQVVDNYVIDVYVVVDTSMFNSWKDWVQETTGEKNESNLNSMTQLFVKNYVSLIFHQANQRFQSLKKHLPYGISLQIVAMSLNVNVPDVNDFTRIATALESFKKWIQPNVTFDHAILMTSKQLTGAESVSYLGRAYLATMCSMTGYSTSIIVDKAFLTSYHLTHELGHNLGAQHDGFNTSASCPQSDSYLMAPVGISSDAIYSDHPWYFSSCSASDIDKYVNFILGKPETDIDIRNCLKNISVAIPEFSNTSDVKAGQEYPADIQCQMLYGKLSRACPDSGPLENICTNMGCVDPTNQFAYNIHFAAEYTSCGPQKWCSMGKCQFDNSAPITTDCPLGDYVTKINGKTCSSAVKETPSLCNYDEVKKNCCKSCKDISSGNPSTCVNGDVPILDDMTCTQRVSIDGINHCYNQAVADKCCGTCKQLWSSTASQNCPYGDKILINGYCQNIRCTGVYKENCCSVCGSVNSGYRISIDFIINSMFSVIVPLHSAYVMIGV